MKIRSIGKSTTWDFGWLYLPGMLAIALAHLINEKSQLYLPLSIFALGMIDSGHVYTTIWRTYLNPRERKRTKIYLFTPIIIFMLFFLWIKFDVPMLGSFILYATLFHNYKQLLGVNSWFQRKNIFIHRWDKEFSYFFILTPIIAAHFRPGFPDFSYYSSSNFFHNSNGYIYKIIIGTFAASVIAWIYWQRIIEPKKPWISIACFLYPSMLYSASFLLANSFAEVLFPLVISHGIAYIGLTSLALKKTRKISYPLLIVFSTAAILGLIEFNIEDNLIGGNSFYNSMLYSFLLTPLFCHYYFDSLIWKRNHPDGPLIYGE